MTREGERLPAACDSRTRRVVELLRKSAGEADTCYEGDFQHMCAPCRASCMDAWAQPAGACGRCWRGRRLQLPPTCRAVLAHGRLSAAPAVVSQRCAPRPLLPPGGPSPRPAPPRRWQISRYIQCHRAALAAGSGAAAAPPPPLDAWHLKASASGTCGA